MQAFLFTRKSSNEKTGPIPVTSSPMQTCPTACPLRSGGCYASNSHMGIMWRKLSGSFAGDSFSHGKASVKTVSWPDLCDNVASLPDGQLWRHNQMGDLPQTKTGTIDRKAVSKLVKANKGKRGFTYTHHAPSAANLEIIKAANAAGFTINLSGNSPRHADLLSDKNAGPVVTILPETISGNQKLETPAGRKIVVCPATYRDDITCASCGLCAVQNRNVIVGFPAHGATKKAASKIAETV